MSNELTLFGGQSGLPAHLAEAFGDEDTNLIVREAVPALTFRGGTWRLKKDGEETVITKPDEDGDAIPVSTVQMIVVGVNQARSRIYFGEDDYVEGESQAPVCWSSNGVAPDSDVESPCARTCASCPWSVKGSKITQNDKEVTACATLKRLAVVPAGKVSMGAMLLKLPQTSVWDKAAKEQADKGFFAWDQYVAYLKARGVKHTAQVVTKIKFDPNVSYPKLLFAAAKFVDADKIEVVKELVSSVAVKEMVTGNAATPEHAVAAEEPMPKTVAKAAPEKVSEVIDTPPKRARAPRKAKAVEQAELPLDDDDDSFGDDDKMVKKQAVKEKPKAKQEEVEGDSTDLDALANQWADFDDE